MIQFKNTAVAFALKSDKDLKKAYWLFLIISSPFVVKTGNLMLRAALKLKLPLKWILKPTLYQHFVGEENLEKCIPVIKKIARAGVYSIPDYATEGKQSHQAKLDTFNEIIKTIDLAAVNNDIAFAVFKPTALIEPTVLEKVSSGIPINDIETEEFELFSKRIDTICHYGFEKNVKILIDAEDYCYQNAIDDISWKMMNKYNTAKAVVFNTFQMYRTDRPQYLRQIISNAAYLKIFAGIKLVRGAYMEKERRRAKKLGYPSPIFADKKLTDKAFNDAIGLCIDNIDHISLFCGTHNEESIVNLINTMQLKGIRNNDDRIWFSQLYGMGDHLSFNLANAGFNVAKYMPYGSISSAIPYLIRRASENTSVKGQSLRELSMIKTEIKRRKNLNYEP